MPRKMRREMPLQALLPGAIVPICGVLIYNPAVGTSGTINLWTQLRATTNMSYASN
jgi:hypothetical protein